MTPFARALIGILPAWRRVCDPRLPLLAFLGPRARVQRLEVLRCGACDRQPRCRRRIAGGTPGPALGCPNAELFY